MTTAPWWQRAVVYHVYPRSFQDDSGDGVGDLPGIRRRLPYLVWLGVDAVWLSPIYRSPMADAGYDVADHCDVDPLFGTLADWDALAADARRLGLRLILDFVPNHTSIEHPWFRERPDLYLWRDAPNNWISVFGGSAWTWDARRGAFYYHAYLPEQPDLDWRSPEVRRRQTDVLRFWLARGADGFRVDALRQVIKDARWRDNPPNPDFEPGGEPYDSLVPAFSTDRPELAEVVRLLRDTVDAAAPEREPVLIGELYLPLERLVAYHAAGLHLPANFHLISTPWRAEAIAALVEAYEAALPEGAWPNWVLGNHDRQRLASRVGPRQARAAAMLLLTLRGTPTIYYGDELGMEDVHVPPGRGHDPWGKRDAVRAPLPWDDGPGRGFSTAEPWLPHSPVASVAAQRADPGSLLALHRRLLALRRAEPALHSGAYDTVAAGDGVLAYVRGGELLVALNLGEEERELPGTGELVLSTAGRATAPARLAPGEGVVLRRRGRAGAG
jgi:alpha-glucosidase